MAKSKKCLDIVTKSHLEASKNEKDIKNIMSQEDYLEVIYTLSKVNDKIKSVDIAKAMHVSRPAVNIATDKLVKKEYITKDAFSSVKITEKGKEIGEMIYKKHIAIMDFLLAIGCSEEIALLDCCKIEHIISDETLDNIKKLTQKLKKEE